MMLFLRSPSSSLCASAARPLLALSARQPLQARTMATLKEIQLRLKSVSNIAKITKSMKMIASTKMTRAQRNMEVARVYGQASNAIFTQAGTKSPEVAEAAQTIVIAVSSDRGLCGGIHSSVSKAVKIFSKKHPGSSVIVLGEKAKPQIARECRKDIKMHFGQVAKNTPNWAEAATIADQVLRNETTVGWEKMVLYFNKFKSVIAFETTPIEVYSQKAIAESANITAYEFDSDEILPNLAEFNFANTLYWALSEGNAAEMAAKRTAMDNATNNARDMITRLTLTYNRGRQAAITNDLCDIITGASALD